MDFRKYQHIERFGTDNVIGIESGLNYVFPKIDGTNASVWLGQYGKLCCGSRNRELSIDNDNAGFCAWATKQENLLEFLSDNPHLRLFGEWLVPHSLRTYRDDAWKRFYVFDVCSDVEQEDGLQYMPYDMYSHVLQEYGIDYIPPIAIIRGGTYEAFVDTLAKNVFLVKDGCGAGEGIVIKNYGYVNKYGRQTWAKIVTNEFKEKHIKAMGAPVSEVGKMVEQEIVDKFCTESFIHKEHAKIVTEKEGWQSQYIPMLLGRVFSELVKEEIWNIVKAHKLPTVNFKTLNSLVTAKVKATKKELFA
jgi:hypothetical protein